MDEIPGLRHEYARINGIRMHYAIAGSGPLVLLLHGFPDFWYTWRRQIAGLAGQFTVVAPDQRGYNETDKPSWGYSVDVLVADVLELIAHLGHERAFLAGHDWGAAVAWAAAITRPERITRLAVLNVPHPAIFAEHLMRNPRQMRRSAYMGLFALPWLPELILSQNDYAPIERILRADLRGAISDAEIAAHKDAVSSPGTLTGGLNWYRAAARQGPRGLYAGTGMRCSVPTLLIHGDRDPFLGRELFAGNERFAPDLRVRPVPGAGHWVHLKEPALVTEELRTHFTWVDSR
jgi:pimeloyl-ACP methyl ester carboxylesterase